MVAEQGVLDALAANRPGRPGQTAAELALEDAPADNARLRDALAEQAIELHVNARKRALGLIAPVPRRIDGHVKAGLLDLIASASRWAGRCGGPAGCSRSTTRRCSGGGRGSTPAAAWPTTPGPTQAPPALWSWERDAILAVYDDCTTWIGRTASWRRASRGGPRARVGIHVLAGADPRGARACHAAA
jgi:hypothetical protein